MQDIIRAEFNIKSPISKEEALRMHPVSLAFIGDAVQSLYTRSYVTLASDARTGALHNEVIKVVRAVSQAAEAEKFLPGFDEDEKDLFRRARNCKPLTSAKHAEPVEYRRATGLEAVIGYLYLIGDADRLDALLRKCCEDCLAEDD